MNLKKASIIAGSTIFVFGVPPGLAMDERLTENEKRTTRVFQVPGLIYHNLYQVKITKASSL